MIETKMYTPHVLTFSLFVLHWNVVKWLSEIGMTYFSELFQKEKQYAFGFQFESSGIYESANELEIFKSR